MSRPRLYDDKFLAFLRTKPCCICGKEGETQACHVRIGFLALGKKPDDRDAVPMCANHHRLQHSMNETEFWQTVGIAPFVIAERLYAEFGGDGGRPRVKRKTVKPRKPKSQRQKIRSRGFPKKERSCRK
jgi:hypothetical protein